MNPDVAAAIEQLRARGVLEERLAGTLLRVARGRLLSMRAELRFVLYVGVLLITGGVGLLVKENLDRIGPAVIAIVLGMSALLALVWAMRRAPRFSWGQESSSDLAFEYVLLLGVLLTGADLAYVEMHFTPLGPAWPWHLLLMSVFAAVAAVRYDSRLVFSLALGTFAAWRGASISFLEQGFWGLSELAAELNAVAVGLAFILLGRTLVYLHRKAHFEPVATYMGHLLILGAMVAGMMSSDLTNTYETGLLVWGAFMIALALRASRYGLFIIGVLGAYVGLCGLTLVHIEGESGAALWFLISSACVVGALLAGRRRMRRPL